MGNQVRSLCDSDALEVMALSERKQNIISELMDIEVKKLNLKAELLELSDASIAKDYNCKTDVIFGIRNGRTYKHLSVKYDKHTRFNCKTIAQERAATGFEFSESRA